MDKYTKNKVKYILLISLVLLLLLFTLTNVISKSMRPFHFIHRLLSPFQSLITGICNCGNNLYSYVTNYKDFLQEKRINSEEANDWQMLLGQNEKLYQENIRLRALLNFSPLEEYQYTGCKVIGFSGSNWQKGLLINKGSKDGIKIKMPVITYNGYLVGQIKEVYPNTAHVVLVTDPSFVVGGLVQREDARDLGVVRGQPWGDGNYVMDNLAWNASIRTGDIIVTSGYSDLFPKDIPIGEVMMVNSGDFGLTKEATLRFFISGITIEEVLVITKQGVKE